MSFMVVNGSEMIRYNPSANAIEASNTRGFSWMMRYRCSGMGNIRALTTLFPVPNTKEDIMDFLALAAPNSKTKGGLWGTIRGRIMILSILAVIVFILCLILEPKDGAGTGAILVVLIAVYGGMACTKMDQDTIRYNKRANAWRAKFDQVLMKGRSLRADPEFSQMLDYYENMVNQK